MKLGGSEGEEREKLLNKQNVVVIIIKVFAVLRLITSGLSTGIFIRIVFCQIFIC